MFQRVFSGTIAVLLMLAAVCAASTAWAAEIILYDGRNFGGQSVTLTQNTPNLGNFDNEASSVKVISGTWILFRNANYGVTPSRPSVTLTPGEYPNLSDAGFPRNRLSSVRQYTDDVVQPAPANCPPPYRVVGAGGQCNWSCAQGTRPGPGGQCVCQSGLVETGQDNAGRRICGPAQLAPPPSTQPDPRQPPGTVQPSSCTGPYRKLFRQNGQIVCKWTCGRNSRPNEARNQCSCNSGYVGRGTDRAGRVRCVAGAGTVAPPPPAASEQIYSAGGVQVIALARQRGYTFEAVKTGPFNATCTMVGNTAVAGYRGTTVTGAVSPAGCTLVLFGGRELAPGWSFHRLEVFVLNHVGGDTGLEVRLRLLFPAIRVQFHDPGQGATQATIESVTLRGPAGRDWREAFQR